VDGGARGSRTPDLLNAIQALSQLSYGPFRDQRSIYDRIKLTSAGREPKISANVLTTRK
jgi:hypothetical protein